MIVERIDKYEKLPLMKLPSNEDEPLEKFDWRKLEIGKQFTMRISDLCNSKYDENIWRIGKYDKITWRYLVKKIFYFLQITHKV